MRTPGILIIGLVLAPCGLILDLTSTVAPSWRTLHGIAGQSSDSVLNQGIWDICKSFTTSNEISCNLKSTDQVYFSNQIIPIAQGMMIASLVVTLIGLAVVTPGARCWTDNPPRWTIVGIGGLLIFCSGVLAIIPIAWYTHLLRILNTSTTFTSPQNPDIRVGYCIVLGYIGGIMEVLGGLALVVGLFRCCGGRNREEKSRELRLQSNAPRATNPMPYPRSHVPRSVPRSVSYISSSVPYSTNSLDDDFDYPGANVQKKGMVNPSYRGRPYDADL